MASSSSVDNLSVEETINIFCDPLLILDASALGYYMDKISTLVAQHGPELQALLPKKDVSPFLIAAKALITEKDSSAIVEILRLLFGAMSPQVIYEKYWQHLADGLAEGLPYDIQGLVLFQLLRIAKDSRGCTELANNKQLLAKVVERLDSVVVAAVATKVLVVVSSQVPNAHKTLFNEELWELFLKVQNKDSICKMRAFEVYCRIAIQSAETAGKLKPQLEQIVKSFREPHRDTLAQLNYIELLTVLVTSPHTLPFVLESGIIADMKQLLIDVTNPGAVYIMPGVCEFFGRFGENHPHLVCDKYLDIINLMLDMTFNIQFQALAISNLALMGRTDEGKRCMKEKLAVDILVLMKAIGTILEGHDSIKKEAVLSALAHLMEVEDVKQEDLMQLTQSWFSAISAKPIQTVYDCLKNFLVEVRLNAYSALKNIALLSWGHDALLEDCPGFYEWLLNRDPNARKIEVDCKFRIVAALLEDANKISNPEKRAALRAHFSEGPFTLGSSVAGVSSQSSQ